MVIAPGPGDAWTGDTVVHRTRSFGVPIYRECRISRRDRALSAVLERFDPDVVHIVAPFILGRRAGRAAAVLGVPVVASYHTDIAGFARRYHLGVAEDTVWAMLRAAHAEAV